MSVLEELLSAYPPDELFHYTSQEGLLGIVGNHELWASKAIHMNDEAEFRLALSLAREAIGSGDGDGEIREELLAAVDEIETIHIFVCSFSAHADLLSQWRGYCPPGAGYSIGFSSAELGAVADRLFGFCFGKCTYDPVKQIKAMEELVGFHIQRKRAKRGGGDTGAPSGHFIWSMSFGEALAFTAPLLKHKAFQEEAEWRLVSRPLPRSNSMFCHRPGRSHIIPFAKLPLSEDGQPVRIRRVIVGPTPHPELAHDAVHSLLGAAGVTGCAIEKSKVPFRSW